MSPEQHPTQQAHNPEHVAPLEPATEVPPVQTDEVDDAAHWKALYEAEAAKSSQSDRAPLSLPVKVGLGVAGLGVAAASVFGLQSLGGEETPDQRPNTSSPEVPETPVAGVSLNQDQLDAYVSGDQTEKNEVIDKVLVPATEKAINDPSKLSSLSTDPLVLTKLKGLAEDAHSRVGESDDGEVYISVAPTELTDGNEDTFNYEASTFNEGEDVKLITYVDVVGGTPVNVRYTLQDITVVLDGNHITYTSN